MRVSLLESFFNKIIFSTFLYLKKWFLKKKELYFVLVKILGFPPNNLAFYKKALLHKSYCKKDQHGRCLNNERLEFLGDAIYNAIITDILYQKFPLKDEGFLSTIRSKIVQRATMNSVAIQLGLDKLIITSINIKNLRTNIMGNTLEAFIGAIYLDNDYRKTKKFIEQRIINPFINIDFLIQKEIDFKSKLFEWSQKNKVLLRFQDFGYFINNNRNLKFQTKISLNGIFAGNGIGLSKLEAHQHASKVSLEKIRKDKSFLEKIFLISKNL